MSVDDHPQMDLGEVTNADLALAYTMQTHLCYSHLQPGEMSFRVLRGRLDSTGYLLVSEADLATELDKHWLAQRVESGIAYCTCGQWEFDARVGQSPLPKMGDRFLPHRKHVAAAIGAAQEKGEAGS